jgi:hypothetical protein
MCRYDDAEREDGAYEEAYEQIPGEQWFLAIVAVMTGLERIASASGPRFADPSPSSARFRAMA